MEPDALFDAKRRDDATLDLLSAFRLAGKRSGELTSVN